MCGFIVEVLQEVECDFASAGMSNTPIFSDVRPSDWVPEARSILPTYDWTTVISKQLAVTLGGVEALRQSGVFHRVAEVAGGSVWLQATERLDEFDQEHGYRLFEVLAPVLPPRLLERPELEEYAIPYAAYGCKGRGRDYGDLAVADPECL